jgi:hypothetical protein
MLCEWAHYGDSSDKLGCGSIVSVRAVRSVARYHREPMNITMNTMMMASSIPVLRSFTYLTLFFVIAEASMSRADPTFSTLITKVFIWTIPLVFGTPFLSVGAVLAVGPCAGRIIPMAAASLLNDDINHYSSSITIVYGGF